MYLYYLAFRISHFIPQFGIWHLAWHLASLVSSTDLRRDEPTTAFYTPDQDHRQDNSRTTGQQANSPSESFEARLERTVVHGLPVAAPCPLAPIAILSAFTLPDSHASAVRSPQSAVRPLDRRPTPWMPRYPRHPLAHLTTLAVSNSAR